MSYISNRIRNIRNIALAAVALNFMVACAPIAPSVTKASLSQKSAPSNSSPGLGIEKSEGVERQTVATTVGYNIEVIYEGEEKALASRPRVKKRLKAEKPLRIELEKFVAKTDSKTKTKSWSTSFGIENPGETDIRLNATFEIRPLDGENKDDLITSEALRPKVLGDIDFACSKALKCKITVNETESTEWMMKRLSALVVVIDQTPKATE